MVLMLQTEEPVLSRSRHDGLASHFATEFPKLVKLMRYIPIGPSKRMGGAAMRMSAYALESLERYERQRDVDPENFKPTLMIKLYEPVDDGTYANEQLVVDTRSNIIAGTDTTAVAVTYTV